MANNESDKSKASSKPEKPKRTFFGFIKFIFVSTVLGIGLVVLFAVFVVGSPSSKSSPTSASNVGTSPAQEPRASLVAAKSEPEKDSREFAKITCKEFSKKFGLQSNLSDLQKDELFKQYKDKWVKWTGEVVEVSTTFGSPSVQVKCLRETLVSDAIISFPRSAKDSLMAYSKGSSITLEAKLERWGALTAHSLDDGRVVQ